MLSLVSDPIGGLNSELDCVKLYEVDVATSTGEFKGDKLLPGLGVRGLEDGNCEANKYCVGCGSVDHHSSARSGGIASKFAAGK